MQEALVRNPKILVLDESTNALDTKTENIVIENLLKEYSDSLILIITHNQNLASKCNFNLNFNNEGKIEYKEN